MGKQNDISQLIHKYLNGELDAHAMHQLEKEAQNDPFLMEALGGYEQSGADQQHNLADVYARLHDRTQKAERRIIPWKWISIAATVLVVLTIGGLWLRNQSPEVNKNIVKVSKPKEATPIIKPAVIDTVEKAISQPDITKQIAKVKPHKARSIYVNAPPASADAAPAFREYADAKVTKAKTDTASLNEVAVVGYGTQKKANSTQSLQSVSQGYLANANGKTSLADSKGPSVSINKETGNTITGIVTAKDDGLPIPGVTIIIKGTANGTQTDANGHFVLNGVPNGAVLKFEFIGYSPLEISAGDKKLLAVNMQANNSSLAEVVVTNAVGVKHDTNDGEQPVYESAHPANGWSEFKKYLKNNAESPDGKTGVVKVSLKVDGNGKLSDFKIKRSLSTETDNAAIQLIEDGPRWISNTDHTSETVTIRVRFEPKK